MAPNQRVARSKESHGSAFKERFFSLSPKWVQLSRRAQPETQEYKPGAGTGSYQTFPKQERPPPSLPERAANVSQSRAEQIAADLMQADMSSWLLRLSLMGKQTD